jgi:hypothetical protein
MMVSAGFVRETTWLTNRNFRSLLTTAARGVGDRPSPRTRIPEFTFEAARRSASLRRMTTGPSQKPCSPRKRSLRRFRQLAQLCDVMVWFQRRPFPMAQEKRVAPDIVHIRTHHAKPRTRCLTSTDRALLQPLCYLSAKAFVMWRTVRSGSAIRGMIWTRY